MDTMLRTDGSDPDKAAWSHYWASAPPEARGCLPGLPGEVAGVFEARWRAFFLRLPDGASVLDLGTGGGAVVRLAAQTRSALRLLGVDYADHLPDGVPGIEFQGGIDFEALPFADQSFDAVSSQFALEYAGPKAVAELLRVLRPRGALMVVAHHAGSAILEQNQRRLAALDALMAEGGLLQAAEDVVRQGRSRDKSATQGLAAILQELRGAHRGQMVIEEVSRLAAHLMNQPDAISQLAHLRSEAAMEQLRLRALGRAALDESSAAALAGGLSQAQRPVRCDLLCAPASTRPLAWHLEGWPG
jgi:SAM-dependent methyltransferase